MIAMVEVGDGVLRGRETCDSESWTNSTQRNDEIEMRGGEPHWDGLV